MKVQVNKKVSVTGVLTLEIEVPQFAGKDVTVTITKTKKIRSSFQNRYYWGVIIPAIQYEFSNVSGEPISETTTHELLKQRFNSVAVTNPNGGEIINVPKSTTENTTTDFEVYLEECRKFAAEFFDIVIPLPNEQAEMLLAEHDQETDSIIIQGG